MTRDLDTIEQVLERYEDHGPYYVKTDWRAALARVRAAAEAKDEALRAAANFLAAEGHSDYPPGDALFVRLAALVYPSAADTGDGQ